jgi:hypothetical protein
MAEKIKLHNPNAHAVGLRLMDGVRELIAHPKTTILVDKDEVYYINGMSRTFSHKHLIILDDSINEELGYAIKGAESMTEKEIEALLKGNHLKMKKELEGITEKHTIDRIISVAKGIEDLATNKIKILSDWSGYDFNQLVNNEEDK